VDIDPEPDRTAQDRLLLEADVRDEPT